MVFIVLRLWEGEGVYAIVAKVLALLRGHYGRGQTKIRIPGAPATSARSAGVPPLCQQGSSLSEILDLDASLKAPLVQQHPDMPTEASFHTPCPDFGLWSSCAFPLPRDSGWGWGMGVLLAPQVVHHLPPHTATRCSACAVRHKQRGAGVHVLRTLCCFRGSFPQRGPQ